MAQTKTQSRKGRRRKVMRHLPRKFLVIVDGSEEEASALWYVSRRVHEIGGAIVLLLIIEPEGIEGWLSVTGLLREDSRKAARACLRARSRQIQADSGCTPTTHIREGEPAEEVLALIDEDKTISTLVLAASNAASGPGPLISTLAGGRLHCPIPITIVPAGLSRAEIEALT